jgi:hypothetical protein
MMAMDALVLPEAMATEEASMVDRNHTKPANRPEDAAQDLSHWIPLAGPA